MAEPMEGAAMTILDTEGARGRAVPAENGADAGAWVALLPVSLSDAEKQCLEAIARLGSFAVDTATYPEEIDRLEESGLLSRERRGETFSRGRSRNDGFDVYQLTELAKAVAAGLQPGTLWGNTMIDYARMDARIRELPDTPSSMRVLLDEFP
jgi:hypothetical protein